MSATCMYEVWLRGPRCGKPAATWRMTARFGRREFGEPALIRSRVYLCGEHARRWDGEDREEKAA